MTIRGYLWGMRLSTLVALSSLGLVIYYVNPVRDGVFGQVLFYVSLFFSVTGLATLFLFWIRRTFSKNGVVFSNVGISFRQGMIIALVVVAMLLVQGFRLLVWWDAMLIIAAGLIIELWFLSRS